jgi:ribosomal protein S18 acetylase RimI-like enzyme
VGDAELVYELMIVCDIAECGEADSDMNDLLAEWTDMELSCDAWLVFAPDGRLAGYGGIRDRGREIFSLDWRVEPANERDAVFVFLLEVTEERVRERVARQSVQMATIVSSVDERSHRTLETAGYQLNKRYFRMMIEMDKQPPAPDWPDGLLLRNVVPGQDDESLFRFIVTAFDWPGRAAHGTFERWRDYVMRPDHFLPELWFLAHKDGVLVGAALCYDYVDYGWVRQLAVRKDWRGRGVGAALLRHAFNVFYERGRRRVGLGVDANIVYAIGFYRRVGMEVMQQHDEYRKAIKPAI